MLLKDVIERIRNAALYCVDTLLTLTRKGPLHPDRVLVIRLDAIGDFILWIDAAQATVRHYKSQGMNVVLVANAVWAALAKQLAVFDEVIALDRSKFLLNPLYRYRAAYRVRMLGCAIAVQPTYSREWLFGDAVVRLSGAAERIGYSGDISNVSSWQKKISDRWYTRLIYGDPTPRMELIRNGEFVQALCDTGFQARLPNLCVATAPLRHESFVGSNAIDQPYYVFFPGAGWEGRRWPVANFAEIAQQLYRKIGWFGVVCGDSADRDLADELCRRCSAPLLNLAGGTDLSQLTEILSKARLLLTNETSATHIAAACGVATICILGGGHYGRFMPYKVEQVDGRPLPRAIIHSMPCFGCNWRCIYERPKGAPVRCIERISVEEVWHAVNEVISSLIT
ncbi:MAG: glycosyltransferase family 9 protein [Terracidiphilus sp.]